ncbi:MAG: hypothetical protein WCH74_10610 [Chloroflexota bacterium]
MTLEEALAGAQAADRSTRIEWRDRIAEHGAEAIEAASPWVADPELGAFAVREFLPVLVALTPAYLDVIGPRHRGGG